MADAGIISAAFYTTLVITVLATSRTGAWLRFVLSKGWPLLSTNPDETWKLGEAESMAAEIEGQVLRVR